MPQIFGQSFVWRSTPESVEAGQVSALATLETAFAVIAYCLIAIYFETHAHLIVSIAAVPLV